jgi:hypothetical protein
MRAVILNFKDNDSAEVVIEVLDALQDAEHPVTANEYVGAMQRLGSVMAAGATPVALLARPTKGCTCSRKHEPWKKTPRFGWYICPNCRLPSVYVVRRWMSNLLASGGHNLIQELRDKLVKEKETEGMIDRAEETPDYSERVEPPAELDHLVPIELGGAIEVPPGITVHDQEITDPKLAAAFEATYGARPAGPVIHPDFVVKGTITGRLPAPEGSVHEPPLQ